MSADEGEAEDEQQRSQHDPASGREGQGRPGGPRPVLDRSLVGRSAGRFLGAPAGRDEAYTLRVAPDGSGTIRTTLGWVGFHLNGRDAFIPAGAMCSTRPNIGPGTPYFEDASPAFREALSKFDSMSSPAGETSTQLIVILREARAKDSLTLWHLLSRTTGPERDEVYDRLATLTPPPRDVTRTGVLQLDPHMLDLYWNALNLGDISVWRFWEQSSSPSSPPSAQLPATKDSFSSIQKPSKSDVVQEFSVSRSRKSVH